MWLGGSGAAGAGDCDYCRVEHGLKFNLLQSSISCSSHERIYD